jgi:hypothetical protein
MQKTYYYHCYFCKKIPSIQINGDEIKINCIDGHEKITNIEDFIEKCVKSCYCENGLCFMGGKYIKCIYCSPKDSDIYNLSEAPIYNDTSNSNLNNELSIFIQDISSKIKESKKILYKMEKELFCYNILITEGRRLLTNESILNLKNLNIFRGKGMENKKEFFIKKLDLINNELKSFHNFEYIPKINEYDKYNESKIHFNNYSHLIETNTKIESIYSPHSNDLNEEKYFKNPERNLYQIYGIKLEEIENKYKYIINKLINISINIEEKIGEDIRNKFLENVKFIGEISLNFSQVLLNILKSKFLKKYQNIFLDNNQTRKRALSSWYNQSLVFDESEKNQKRLFFVDKCKSENFRIIKYNIIDPQIKGIFSNNLYNFQLLFSDLTQLYTEAKLYSEKVIEFKKVENCNFINEQMKDITDISGKKKVIYSVLPGLFSENNVIGKIIVFCEKRYECIIQYESKDAEIIITINTIPRIYEKNVKYYLEWKEMGGCLKSGPNNVFILDKGFKNRTAIARVFKNGKPLCESEKKIDIKENIILKFKQKKNCCY